MPRQTLPPVRRRRPRSFRLSIEGLEPRSLLSTLFALTDTNRVLSFDSASPGTIQATTPITGLTVGESIDAIDVLPTTGAVYGLGSQDHLYAINLRTGAATVVSSTAFTPGIVGSRFSIDANPVTLKLRLVDDSGQNLRIDPTTGSVIGTDASLGYVVGDPNNSAVPNIVAVAHTSNHAGATSTTAYAIDSSLGNLVLLGSIGGSPDLPDSGHLRTVGSLGVSISNAVGFDIIGPSDTAYAALTPTVGAIPALYTVNLATGAAASVGTIGDGTAHIIGLAASILAPPPAPTLAAASDSGSSNSDHVTNVKTPVILGTAEYGATVTILANGVLVGAGTADASGNYSVTTSTLADGTYTVQALQTDASGLTSGASAALSPALVIDTVAPAVPSVPALFSQLDTGFSSTDNFTRDNVPQFFGTAEANSTVNLFANGVAVGQGAGGPFGNYAIQSSQLADGVYQVTADQVDLAGNVGPMSAALAPPLTIDTSSRPTPAEAFVAELYLDILGRPVDQAGLDHWTPMVTQPNGRAIVVQGIQATPEARQAIASASYQLVLHRAPEANSLVVAGNYLLTHTDEQFIALLAGSAEYFQSHGSNNQAFLEALYPDLLGRSLDGSALAQFLPQLNAGASRTSIALTVMTSNERYINLTNGLYQKFLNRSPGQSELSNAVAFLNGGGTDEQLVAGLAVTTEYFQDARGSNTLINQWGKQVYLDLLGRPADPSGLAALTALLDQDESPPQAVAALQDSDEYRGTLVASAYETVLRRAPEASAVVAGDQYLASGGTVEGLKSLLYGSAEYFQNQGGNTNAGFLAALYQDVVARPIDPGALANGLALLSGGTPRSAIASSLVRSIEGETQTVQALYLTYLRRFPSFGESTTIAANLASQAYTDQFVIASLVGSPEYFSKL